MNRPIKFRAWDGEKLWLWNDKESCLESWAHEKTTLAAAIQLGWTLMQFTGLTDAKGREIYEGDLVTWRKVMRPRVVEFFDGFYAVGIVQTDGEIALDDSLMDKLRKVEVIGNIYENPELLAV